jgi:CRISPR-associated endonuclease Csn1
MKQNEYFVFPNKNDGFNPNEIDLLSSKNNKLISPHLFRVQKLATGDYWFRHHLETSVEVKSQLKDVTYKRCSLSGIKDIIKVSLNHIGQIVKVGEC